LLAVVFVVLGFCLCLGAFDRIPITTTLRNVAFASYGRDGNIGISGQFFSDITLDSYTDEDLNNVFGFFVNQNFSFDEDSCPFTFSSEEDKSTTRLFSYSLDDITVDLYAQHILYPHNDTVVKAFLLYGVTADVAGDIFYIYCSPNARFVFDDYSPIAYCGYFDGFGENHIFNFNYVCPDKYKSYIEQIINFSWCFDGVPDSVLEDIIAERDRIQQEYNEYIYNYSNAFSYVPVEYSSPSRSVTLERKNITKDTILKNVFIVRDSVKISELIDDNGNLIYDIHTRDVFSPLWDTYFDLYSFNDFIAFLQMANLTPLKSNESSKGCVYSYDAVSRKLTKFSDPISFATKEDEQRYEDIKSNLYKKAYDDGKLDVENSWQTSTDGIISVLQSPINFLKTVFSFEILGINVSGVVFFILSIVIVAFVVRKVV